jgi:hypothetical protein
MRSILLTFGLALAAIASPARAQVGQKPPELEAVKWYNTPALTWDQLQGKAVMIEVFRTW